MHCLRRRLPLLLVTLLFAGCASMTGQPALTQAMVSPAVVTPGQSAVITVEVNDPFVIVDRIEGVVKQEPRVRFVLNDAGREGDAVAGDNVWSLSVDAPIDAPEGEFVLEIVAYDADGKVIKIRTKEGVVQPLSSEFVVEISR